MSYWQQVEAIARAGRDRRAIYLGDFNLDPGTDTRPYAKALTRLTDDGFTLAQPKGDWSYHGGNGTGGTRIDHALATPGLSFTDARYLYKAGRHLLAGVANGSAPLSDHALLSIRVARLPAHGDPPTMHRKCIANGPPARS